MTEVLSISERCGYLAKIESITDHQSFKSSSFKNKENLRCASIAFAASGKPQCFTVQKFPRHIRATIDRLNSKQDTWEHIIKWENWESWIVLQNREMWVIIAVFLKHCRVSWKIRREAPFMARTFVCSPSWTAWISQTKLLTYVSSLPILIFEDRRAHFSVLGKKSEFFSTRWMIAGMNRSRAYSKTVVPVQLSSAHILIAFTSVKKVSLLIQ